MRRLFSICFLFFLSANFLHAQSGEARLLRFPTTHGDTIVFSYAGNLYTVSAGGGVARKLTNHDGYEMFARFSPDGKHLALTAQYDGNTEVYLMPADGGVPKRLTYTATLRRDEVSDRMGPNNIVLTWKNNQEIVFRSRMREHNDFIGQLYTISVEGGLPEQLPLPRGGFCSFSPDGKKLAYNRVFREFRTWKRYRGGMTDDIWVYDFDTKKLENITNNDAGDIIPMWSGSKIYFLSDRDTNKRWNLYVYDTSTQKTRQLTQFTDYDIKFPSLGGQAIVFEYAGYIYRFDLKTEKADKVPIQIREDFAGGRPVFKDVSKNIAAYEISPDGKRALFGARGDIFTVPAKDGPTRNLTATSGIHERNPKWSPDGKWIAVISDETGEDEIHLLPQDGVGQPVPITSSGGPYKYHHLWSPDSKKILWADKKMRLFYVDVADKKVKQIDQSKVWEIHDYQWSPDSQWVAYQRYEEDSPPKIWLYSLVQEKSFPVTDGWYDASRPTFSSDGKYLFFVAETEFRPTYSETEWNHAYVDLQKLYLVTLSKDTPSPFQPKSDEVAVTKEETKPADKKEEKKEEKKEPAKKDLKVDTAGMKQRILALPVAAGNYSQLQSAGGNLFYIRSSRKDAKSTFHFFDLAQRKEVSLGSISGYEISANGQKMLVSKDGSYGIIDLPKSTVSIEPLTLSGMQVIVDRQKEWKQIFHEAWRQMRDYFYDPNLHGVDWKAMKAKYEPLLAHVQHRADLTYVIGEMISELNAGHAYVGDGDLPKVQKIPMGLLGAELVKDAKSGAYKIARILDGVTWDEKLRSPLQDLGINVEAGEYILAVNGQPTAKMSNIYESLINTVGKQVRLRINKEPLEKGSREVTVVPIGDEQPLYYYNWVQGNIKKVNEATKGQVGYLHIPDMLSNGLNEFVKHYYPQLRKKALIIDVRGNGGGNVSPMIIERLRREIAMIAMSRDTQPRPEPNETFVGPMVCLMNEFSASDGDLFPFRFRHYKLGKLIGKRSWGGVIGIRGSLPFVDGGTLNKPEFSRYGLDGKTWIIEGVGVDPDIVVDNDPAREFAGIDDQLNKGIEVILEQLRTFRSPVLPLPEFPKR